MGPMPSEAIFRSAWARAGFTGLTNGFSKKLENQALEIATRALRFYETNEDRLEAQVKTIREREKAISTFSNKDKVSSKELVAA